MNVQFRNEDGIISPAIQERIERKLAKLSVLTDTEQDSAVATFDLEKAVGSHQNGNIWKASITIVSGGTQFYTDELADSPEKAADSALREIRRQIRKTHGKQRALVRRGGSLFKSITQRFSRSG